VKNLCNVARKAVGHFADRAWIFIRQIAEAEFGMIEGIDEPPHVFDAGAENAGIIREAGSRKIIGHNRCMHMISGQNAALRANMTPLEKTGSKKQNASPTRSKPSIAQCLA